MAEKITEEKNNITRAELNNVLLSVAAALVFSVGTILIKCLAIQKIEITGLFALKLAGAALFYLINYVIFAVYVFSAKREYLSDFKHIFSIYCITIVSNLIFVAVSYFNIFAIPVITASMLVVLLVDRKLAFLSSVSLFLAFLATFSINPSFYELVIILGMVITGIFMSAVMMLFTKHSIKRFRIMIIGILTGLIMPAVMGLSNIINIQNTAEYISALPYMAVGMVGGVFLAMFIQPVMEICFNLVTDIRLIEMTDFKHPLLDRLRTQAPGTFHHSLTVANLAETCAAAIDEDVYMARAAALYHDVGKLKAPLYYKENQSDYNPHDELTPEASVNVLSQHTVAGRQIAAEYKIPKEVAGVTVEHHGTMPIAYFYHKAQKLTENELDINQFKYLGPLPSTKIAAIIMICDASEAAVRSLQNPNTAKINKLIWDIIDARLQAGQFDNCNMTMNELYKIRQTLNTAFTALYHQRIEYPDQQK